MAEQQTSFEVYVLGEIGRGRHFDRIPLSCEYELCICDPWFTASPRSASSAYDKPQDAVVHGHVFQLPFEVQFNSTALHLWPSMILNVFTLKRGQRQLYAIGQLAIPCCSGHFDIKVECFYYNYDHSYKHVKQLLQEEQTENIGQVVIQDAAGEIDVSMHVIIENFDSFKKQWKQKTFSALEAQEAEAKAKNAQ